MAGRRLEEYEPVEQSLLHLLRAVTHLMGITQELYLQMAKDLDRQQFEKIQDSIRQVADGIDSAIRSLEESARSRELTNG